MNTSFSISNNIVIKYCVCSFGSKKKLATSLFMSKPYSGHDYLVAVCEDFTGLYESDSAKAEILLDIVNKSLVRLDLSFKNYWGQCCDSCPYEKNSDDSTCYVNRFLKLLLNEHDCAKD